MQKADQPHPDRPWAITYSDGTKTRVLGRYGSRSDAEMAIVGMRRIIHFEMLIIWDGLIKDIEKLASAR
jgi:hypothetical protein